LRHGEIINQIRNGFTLKNTAIPWRYTTYERLTTIFRQFGSPLFGFFWFVPGFVEVDEVVYRLLRVWVHVTEFEPAAFFDGVLMVVFFA